jgi:hypothetical protein
VTAVLTSTFVEQARRQHELQSDEPTNTEMSAMLAELIAKVDNLEVRIREFRDDPDSRSDPDR